ncbi:hypothetical protein ACJJTC_009790 [Scirpophaga incertulas]
MVNLTDTLMINTVADGAMNILRNIGLFKSSKVVPPPPQPIIVKMPLWELAQEAGPFVRLAGLSGASAVVLGAMGAHRTFPKTEEKDDLRKIFDTANRFHFLHTLALVTVPLCKRPCVAGALFIVGMSLFCGTCYYHAFTGDRCFRRLTPIGGSCLILGWLAMVL